MQAAAHTVVMHPEPYPSASTATSAAPKRGSGLCWPRTHDRGPKPGPGPGPAVMPMYRVVESFFADQAP